MKLSAGYLFGLTRPSGDSANEAQGSARPRRAKASEVQRRRRVAFDEGGATVDNETPLEASRSQRHLAVRLVLIAVKKCFRLRRREDSKLGVAGLQQMEMMEKSFAPQLGV